MCVKVYGRYVNTCVESVCTCFVEEEKRQKVMLLHVYGVIGALVSSLRALVSGFDSRLAP